MPDWVQSLQGKYPAFSSSRNWFQLCRIGFNHCRATLYKDKTLPLGAAARLSSLPLTQFVDHLSGLGIDIVQMDETTGQEIKDIGAGKLSGQFTDHG